jgi:hypothetical protein
MHHALIITGLVILTLVTPGVPDTAAAQTPGPEPIAVESAQVPATPRVTVRFHAGPNLSLMKDWRNGMSTLQDIAGAGGTDKYCICMSWGSTALVHVTPRVAIGGAFEMLRDTRKFSVDGYIPLIGQNASFAFGNETVVQTKQVVAALYPREGSRTHVQVAAGTGRGHTTLDTPGSGAKGRVRGTLVSVSAGTESRFWYVDAGWRLLRMRSTYTEVNDYALDEPRDVFANVGQVEDFIRGRDVDFTGGWARIGLVFHFGRQ